MARKTWKVSEDAAAGIQIGPTHATMAVATANDVNGVHVDESGVYIRGKLSIMSSPEQIRLGGLWMQQSGWRQMFPSTMAFPNPQLILAPSMAGITEMAQSVAWMMGMLV